MASNRTKTPAKKPAQTGARADGGLTQRQEAFCLAFVETGNASEAYRRAYKPRRMSTKSIHEKASHILAQGKVQARVAELRGKAAEKTVFGLAEHLKELDRLKALAEAKGNCSAAIRAEELRGKVSGFYVERTMDVTNPFADAKPEEVREFIAEMRALKARQEAGTDGSGDHGTAVGR